jgi:bifunctional DNA-binding transcriptional regulator/antitoxin component of YhaV-PrlF toxin-antitoxin module
LYVNVTDFGREVLDLEDGDTVEVTVLRDGILVEPARSDGDTP